MTFNIIETYSTGDYTENNVWGCSICGRTYSYSSEGDAPCCCECEFENEGME